MIPRPTAAGPSRRQWIVLVCLFVLSLPAVTPRLYSSDEIQYFSYLRSLWFDHDLSFENEYRYFYDRNIARSDGFHETFLERQTETGRQINFGTLGCAILWSPFYGMGDIAAGLTGAPRDGFSSPYIAGVAYGSALYGFLAIVLAVLCAQRLGLNGWLAGLAVWLGTPLLFYMYVAPPFSHACSAFAVALFTYVWLRVRDDWSPAGMAALGAAAALMAMTREQDVFFIAGPALDWVLSRGARREARGAVDGGVGWGWLAATVCFLIAYSPQLIAYRVLNGHFGPHASVAHKMKWYAPHALQVLFSPEHGYLLWTPLALLAITALVLFPPEAGSYRDRAVPPEGEREHVASAFRRNDSGAVVSAFRRNSLALALLLMFLLQVYIGGSVDSWTIAGGFGQRRFVALTAILVIGVSALQEKMARRRVAERRLVTALVVLCVYWNIALTAEFAIGLMNRQLLEPARNVYDAFVTLPGQAPSIAYRYFFDRGSFYKPAS